MLAETLRNRSPFIRYALGAASVVPGLLLCELFRSSLLGHFSLPLLAGVAVAAWSLGLGPALAALLISTAAAAYFFVPPYYSFSVAGSDSAISLALFALTGLLISGLIENLARAREEIAESKERSRNLGELVPFGIWTSDGHGRITHLSDSFLRAFRTRMKDCRDYGWTSLIVPQERAAIVSKWRAAAGSAEFWDQLYHMESRDGNRIAVLSRGVSMTTREGRSWVGIHLDVTEHERAAEARVQQERELARYNAEMEQLAYVSAHDLQEPLRMIASYVQLLERKYKGKLDADADTYVAYAVEGATRLRSLLQDLGVLAEVGRSREKRRPQKLADIVDAAISCLSPEIQLAGGQITRDEELPCVNAHPGEMHSLFLNLLENAIQYRRDEAALRVHVSVEQERNCCRVCVRDNGIGIAPEYHERIFLVFQRLHARTVQAGTGIGLAICKKIVESHGGRIWVESEPNRGAAFYFTLPAGPPLPITHRA